MSIAIGYIPLAFEQGGRNPKLFRERNEEGNTPIHILVKRNRREIYFKLVKLDEAYNIY